MKAVVSPVFLEAPECLCWNPPALLSCWRSCDTEAIHFLYYALLSSLNPLRVFELLMNFECSVWQFPRERVWKAFFFKFQYYNSACKRKNRFWGPYSLVDHCESGTLLWCGAVFDSQTHHAVACLGCRISPAALAAPGEAGAI